MPKLNDTQRILLSTACQRDSGSLLPIPACLADVDDRASKALSALIKSGHAEERETSDAAARHRSNGDIDYGVFATAVGCAAIGIGWEGRGGAVPTPPAPPAVRTSKRSDVIALLQQPDGATTAELIASTDWLPHTMRAALTGLRKSGHTIERSKRGTETCYRIVVTA